MNGKPDLKKIPTRELYSELGRRRAEARWEKSGGRPVVAAPCPLCGGLYGARDMRAHVPQCRKAAAGIPAA